MPGDTEAAVDAAGRAAPSARLKLTRMETLSGAAASPGRLPPHLEMELTNANGSLLGSRPNNHKAREP